MLQLLALSLGLVVSTCRGDQPSFYNDTQYNLGEYGQYVLQTYHSTLAYAPRLNFINPFNACDDGSHILLSPRGSAAPPAPTILDASGSLVWMSGKYGSVYNLRVQEYRGQKYLTFWVGDDTITGHGTGSYIMLDQHYNEAYHVSAGNGLAGDQHEFLITPEGTALMSIYQNTTIDLSVIEHECDTACHIWESLFQEVDIETGQVLFEWRASEHFDFDSSYNAVNNFGNADAPWDWYHLNSVAKDAAGNYLVSSRYLRHAAYISGSTGARIWELGGKHNSFRDLSHGTATTFTGQHDARWENNYTAITLFDNRADFYYRTGSESRGVRIGLDHEQMTARLEAEFVHPAHILSTSQGSLQTLPSGHVLIGYGYNGVFTEYSAEGQVLCDAYFEPRSGFDSGDVQSYRVMKFAWTGLPETAPSLAFFAGAFYLSWMGSTEVRRWLIQHADSADGPFEDVAVVEKRGFETPFVVDEHTGVREYARAAARDADGKTLNVSAVINYGQERELWRKEEAARFWSTTSVLMRLGTGFMAMISLVVTTWLVLGKQIAASWGAARLQPEAHPLNDEHDEDEDEDEEQPSCFWECLECLWDLLPDRWKGRAEHARERDGWGDSDAPPRRPEMVVSFRDDSDTSGDEDVRTRMLASVEIALIRS